MKKKRHEAIIDLIRNNDIENQTELAKKLNDEGFKVTQATVSRDIQKLKLIKIKNKGKFKYAIIDKPHEYSDRYIRTICDCITNLDAAKNILIIKTQIGMAMATATAIDGLQFEEIVGTIAGDDSIFVATKSDDKAMILQNKIEVLMRK